MINAQDKVVSLVTKAENIIKTVGDRPPTIHQVEEKDDKELCKQIERRTHQDQRSYKVTSISQVKYFLKLQNNTPAVKGALEYF